MDGGDFRRKLFIESCCLDAITSTEVITMGMCTILRKRVQYFGYRNVWGYPHELCVVGLQMPRTSRSRRNSPVRHVARDRPPLPTVDDTKQAQPSLLFTTSMQPRRFSPSLTKRRRRTRDRDSKPGRKKKNAWAPQKESGVRGTALLRAEPRYFRCCGSCKIRH